MEEARRLSLPDHGQRRHRQTGDEPAGKARRRDRSAMNEVLNHDTLSSTHYFSWSGAKRIGVISALSLVLTNLPPSQHRFGRFRRR
jgi:hypothetical protein